MAAKVEPASPLKEPRKGKEPAAADEGDLKFRMADWAQDPALWDKVGGDTDGGNLGNPVKTIEVTQTKRSEHSSNV